MKVLAIELLRQSEADPVILAKAMDLSSFGYFKQSTIREMIDFFCQTIVKRTALGQRRSVTAEDYVCHVFVRPDGLAGVFVCDDEYPSRVAFSVLTKVIEQYSLEHSGGSWAASTWPPLVECLKDAQDPKIIDKIAAIQSELDDTTEILRRTIEDTLKRGEQLDELVTKSKTLSVQSQVFYTRARATNSCCTLM
ncbi:palmitoyltransferase [Aphanomyces cochlioides]|nr:palmitoyltransferase [Aphanomyces cochlioides]